MSENRIYLTGMPASGKTTFGKALALQLGWQFTDLDAEIEKREGRSIARIFEEEGEPHFRQLERQQLRRTLPGRAVIATGGGTPCFFDNMDFINQHGISVFLQVPANVLASRSLLQHGQRPLLKNWQNTTDLEQALQQKMELRLPFYQRSAVTLYAEKHEIEVETALLRIKKRFPLFGKS